MNQLPDGFRMGHWDDAEGLTGCTVILCPPKTVGGCDVRGNSPGSRELALLASEKTMQEVHALLLTGGSAYGLAAADGVMRFLEEHDIGYKTPWVKVPIVPSAVIFDLNIGSPTIRPTADSGYRACVAALNDDQRLGAVGAGMGATVGKWGGTETRMRGGLGVERVSMESLTVCAVAVVNAMGDIVDEAGGIIAGARTHDGKWLADEDGLRRMRIPRGGPIPMTNTTLVALLTNARLSKVDANRLAQRGHDGMARAVRPVHTSYDGDIVFALASGQVDATIDLVAEMGSEAAARAIRCAVRETHSAGGAPSATTR
jgi:L-aminopeptidase/D-esterase-like protein